MKHLFVWIRECSRSSAYQAVSPGAASKPVFAGHPRSWWTSAWGLVTVLLLSACASKPVVIPVGADHPADPVAVQAPLPPASATLTSEPVAAPPPDMGGDHHMHRMNH